VAAHARVTVRIEVEGGHAAEATAAFASADPAFGTDVLIWYLRGHPSATRHCRWAHRCTRQVEIRLNRHGKVGRAMTRIPCKFAVERPSRVAILAPLW